MEAFITNASLIVTLALQVFILILLIKKRLHGRFFWLLAYIIYELIESSLRLAVSGNNSLYWTVFWWTEIGDVTFMVLAFGESFLNTFREYTRLRLFVAVVWSCIGAALLYAFFKALVFPPVQANRRGTIIIGLEVAINFALGVVAVLYFTLRALLKINDRQWESGIISGFSIYVAFGIFGYLVRSMFGKRFGLLNHWLSPVGYLLAELAWVLELSRSERKPRVPIRNLTVDDLTKLEHYSRALERFLGRKA